MRSEKMKAKYIKKYIASHTVVRDIKMAFEWISTWFQNNSMKNNEVCNEKIKKPFFQKLLGIAIDTELKYEEHFETLCKKPVRK